MENDSDKVFSSNFIRMFTANVFLTSGFYMIMPLLPVYAVQDLGIDKGLVGLIVGVFAISGVIARPVAGAMLDRYGRMIIYIPASAVFALCFGLYIFAWTFLLLLLARVAHGFSWGTVNTATNTVVSDIVPPKVRGAGLGYFGLSMTAAMALGPAVGTFLMERTSFGVIFSICMALALTALAVSWRVRPPAVKRDPRPFSPSALFEKRVFGIAFMQYFFGFVYSGVMAYPVLHGIEIGAGSGIKWFFLVFAVFIAVFRPFAGRFMDRRGPSGILTVGFLCFAAGLVFLAHSSGEFTFLASAAAIGLGVGFVMPTMMTMTVNVVPPSRRGAANATSFTAFDTGIGTGAVVLGVISKPLGYSSMYIISALVLAIPLLWYYFFEKARYFGLMRETGE